MTKPGVAFLDLLGFTNLVMNKASTAYSVLDDFYNIIYEKASDYSSVNFTLFSDSLIMNSQNIDDLIAFASDLYRLSIIKTVENSASNPDYLMLIRGSIAYGNFYTQVRATKPNVSKNFIISPALTQAVSTEKMYKGSRLIILYTSELNIEAIKTSHLTKTVFYDEIENSTGKVKYCDILWPTSGLTLNERESSALNILEKSTQLYLSNKDSKHSIQYLETLRISMISYAQYLSSRFPLPDLISNLFFFTNDDYFDLWYTILEAIMLVPDRNWNSIPSEELIIWYRKILLSKNWKKVQDRLHKTGNEYIFDRYKKFHNLSFNAPIA